MTCSCGCSRSRSCGASAGTNWRPSSPFCWPSQSPPPCLWCCGHVALVSRSGTRDTCRRWCVTRPETVAGARVHSCMCSPCVCVCVCGTTLDGPAIQRVVRALPPAIHLVAGYVAGPGTRPRSTVMQITVPTRADACTGYQLSRRLFVLSVYFALAATGYVNVLPLALWLVCLAMLAVHLSCRAYKHTVYNVTEVSTIGSLAPSLITGYPITRLLCTYGRPLAYSGWWFCPPCSPHRPVPASR